MKSDYRSQLSEFKAAMGDFDRESSYPHLLECMFESLRDWSSFYTLEEVKSWFREKKEKSTLEVLDIPLNNLKDWYRDHETGNIQHKSKDFFVIHGVRVKARTRETEIGWDQPILEQVGYDGGLLGIIRQRFDEVPHYLCEAKEEPGNYGKVQISPTLQATYSNLNQAHGGRKPNFSEFFINKDSNSTVTTLFEAWLAEDGGRLYLKRNKGMLVEVDQSCQIELPNQNFIWLSLFQIKELLKEDAWVNPHVRGILAHV